MVEAPSNQLMEQFKFGYIFFILKKMEKSVIKIERPRLDCRRINRSDLTASRQSLRIGNSPPNQGYDQWESNCLRSDMESKVLTADY